MSQLIFNNFTELNKDLINKYLIKLIDDYSKYLILENESCIKYGNKLYARSYKYSCFGQCEINDRLFPIKYIDEVIDNKHYIDFELL